MTFHYPRHVKDLPTLEVEDESEQTPQEPKNGLQNAQKYSNANKENEPAYSNENAGTKNSSAFANMRKYPKRSSELPAFESDSEEDDHLNCAILNDSFLLSPGRSDLDESSRESSAVKRRPGISTPSGNLSFIHHFKQMGLHSLGKELNTDTANNNGKKDYPPPKAKEVHAPEAPPVSKTPALQTPSAVLPSVFFPSVTSTAAPNAAPVATPAPVNGEFATPQVRSFSVKRRPPDLHSTQAQKSRNAIANEFRSQKVLFQTPMATPRVPNESVSLLCDTINESLSTPTTLEKTQQPETSKDPSNKWKKSLEGAFKNAGTVAQPKGGEEGKSSNILIKNVEYEIVKKLGCGGSSQVYLARRCDTGKECALKVVDLHGDPAVVEGYLNETKLLAKLQGNVCVVALFEYQLLQKESKLFLVMEKGDSDLHKILQTYTTSLPLYVLMNFLYQMLQAVNYIHQNGVIHSDLKPANFLMVNGRLKLIDFGIASNIAIDSTSIIKFSQAGTFNYISPEALTDTSTGSSPMRNNQPKIKISTKSDVWSLGCILYLLLYQRTPFSHIKNIYAKISAISSPTHVIEYPPIAPYYPTMLVHMVRNCLQHNPKKRPSCADLLKYPFNMVIPIQNLAVPASSKDP